MTLEHTSLNSSRKPNTMSNHHVSKVLRCQRATSWFVVPLSSARGLPAWLRFCVHFFFSVFPHKTGSPTVSMKPERRSVSIQMVHSLLSCAMRSPFLGVRLVLCADRAAHGAGARRLPQHAQEDGVVPTGTHRRRRGEKTRKASDTSQPN